jgi:hypothetical protein
MLNVAIQPIMLNVIMLNVKAPNQRLLALPTIIRVGWKCLERTITLIYSNPMLINAVKRPLVSKLQNKSNISQFIFCCSECNYAKFHYAEYHGAACHKNQHKGLISDIQHNDTLPLY